jgi:hypothetical protein
MEEIVTPGSIRGKLIVVASIHLKTEGWESLGVFVREAPKQCADHNADRKQDPVANVILSHIRRASRWMYRPANRSLEASRRCRLSENVTCCRCLRTA